MNADVIVIGSGQTGVPLAARLAEAGREVIIVEAGHLGGTCVNVGCTPTKTMVASARLAAIVDRKDAIVQQWRKGVGRRLERAGGKLKLIEGQARFVGEREVEVNGERHRAETLIVNVGARPHVPPVAGLGGVEWLDSSSIMDVREPPEHLVVMGGGYIACEFGQMFRRFGSNVTIMQRGRHLLPREDTEVCEAIEEVFRSEGIVAVLGAEVVEVEKGDGEVVVRCGGDRAGRPGIHRGVRRLSHQCGGRIRRRRL